MSLSYAHDFADPNDPNVPRILNVRFLACLILAVAVLGTGVHFLHAFQIKRHARAFYDQAEREEEQQHLDKAAEYLHHYLTYEPDQVDAKARWGVLLDRMAKTYQAKVRAASILEQVLQREPDRHELRQRVIRAYLGVKRYPDAAQHVEHLLNATPEDPEMQLLLGQCQEGTGDYDGAIGSYREALKFAPGKVEAAVLLARVLRDHKKEPARADAVMNQLVVANEQSAPAHLARARYQKEHGSLEEAVRDATRAQVLAPDDADVLLFNAALCQEKKNFDEARALVKKALERQPKQARLYLFLSRLELQAGQQDEAVAALRRGLEAVPKDLELMLILAELLIDTKKLEEAKDALANLRPVRAASPTLSALVDFLEARLTLANGEWLKGTRLLEKVRPQLNLPGIPPTRPQQADLLLGVCYERLGDSDRVITTYRRSMAADPTWVAPRLQLAGALLNTGRIEEALEECRKLTAMKEAPAASWALYARAALLHTLRQPPAQRKWPEVEQLLDKAAAVLPESGEITVMRAEALAAQGKADQARAIAEQLRDKHPDRARAWAAVAGFTEREGGAEKSLEVIEQAQKKLGDTVDMRLLRVRFWAKRRGLEAKKALAELAQGLDKFTDADRLRLHAGLAEAYFFLGELREAQKLWEVVAAQQKENLHVRLVLLDLALQDNQEETAKVLFEEIRKLEGEDGTLWRYADAAWAVAKARRADKNADKKQHLEPAKTRLIEVATRRPTWSRVPLLQADIYELEGNTAKALENYLRAIELGEQQPRMVRRVLLLLSEQRRYAEADKIIRKLQERNALSAELGHAAAEVALQTEDRERALELARQVVPPDSKEYRDHVWLSQFFAALDRRPEAEASLRRAIDLGGTEPAAWLALISYLLRTGEKGKAEAALLTAQSKLPADRAGMALAQGYEMLGRVEQADKQYQAVLTARPQDIAVITLVAGYFLRRGKPADAEPLLNKLLSPELAAPKETVAWARRTLAGIVAGRGGFRNFENALAMLAENVKAYGETPDDRRAKAALLATQPSRRRTAMLELESSRGQGPLTPEEQFLLARLYSERGDWPKAREQMQLLLTAHGTNPRYVAQYIGDLLQRGEHGEAGAWMARLEKLDPRSFVTLSLKAQLHHKLGQSEVAAGLLKEFAQKHGEAAFPAVAATLEQVSQNAAAEEFYRKSAAASKSPAAGLPLVGFLVRQNRLTEALDLMDKAWMVLAPEAMATLTLELLNRAQLNPEQTLRVQEPVEAALRKNAKNGILLLILALIRDFHQGRPQDGISLYRQVLELEPNNYVALNNLAFLLALHEKNTTEALGLVNRAMTEAGPEAAMLDTRAVIYMAAGRNEEAIRDLFDAITTGPTAYRYFHLAQARLATRNRLGAMEAFAKAQEMSPNLVDALHPLERPACRRLALELSTKQ